MNELGRRGFLGAAAGLGGATAVTMLGPVGTAFAEPTSGGAAGAVTVLPNDSRYRDLVSRGYNTRFVASPESVRVVHTADQVAAALNEAVRTNKRVTVRSGGHCFDNLVDDPAVQMLIDVSEMKDVRYDPEFKAIAVGAGATLGQLYRTLFLNWGTTLPAGVCPSVGVAGHVTGGGYGPFSRRDGLVVDHLYAVEVVTVDAKGKARTVVATRRANDPNRELWWAHTGGGGGTFGVATRFWFRSPAATGADPATLLPRAPATLLKKVVNWSWQDLTQDDFRRLIRQHGAWHAANSAAGTPYDSMHTGFHINGKAVVPGFVSTIDLDTQIDAAVPNAEQLLDSYIAAVGDGVAVTPTITRTVLPFLKNMYAYPEDPGIWSRLKIKSAYLRKPWNDTQIDTLYRHLTVPFTGTGVQGVLLYSYGAAINTVPPSATAAPQRDSILKAWFNMLWADPAFDDQNVAAIRETYREMYAATGGVPAPGPDSDGCYINYPDPDLTDPQWNTSGVPWSTLYFKEGYERLQNVKARWDPRNVFRHALSVQPPAR